MTWKRLKSHELIITTSPIWHLPSVSVKLSCSLLAPITAKNAVVPELRTRSCEMFLQKVTGKNNKSIFWTHIEDNLHISLAMQGMVQVLSVYQLWIMKHRSFLYMQTFYTDTFHTETHSLNYIMWRTVHLHPVIDLIMWHHREKSKLESDLMKHKAIVDCRVIITTVCEWVWITGVNRELKASWS